MTSPVNAMNARNTSEHPQFLLHFVHETHAESGSLIVAEFDASEQIIPSFPQDLD